MTKQGKEEKRENNIVLVARIFLFVIYLVGLIGISLQNLRPAYVQITPVSLMLSALILLAFHEQWNLRTVLVLAGIGLAGYFIEVLGVQTGVIFGDYTYGTTLGPAVAGVPLIIGINWLILIYAIWYVAGKLTLQPFIRIPLTGALMVGFDLLMEPVAVALDMWEWSGKSIPFENYLAWFGISLVFAAILYFARIRIHNPVAGYLLLFMAFFFGVLNFTV